MTDESGAPTVNRSVERACALLSAFSSETPQLTLAELAARVALPKPTVYRIASTLIGTGFMSQAADGRYGLGFRLMELGAIVRNNLDVVRTCLGAMTELAGSSGETVILGEADWPRREVTIVHRIDSPHTLSVLSPVGRRSTIPPGVLGKALLMGLDPSEAAVVVKDLNFHKQTSKTHTNPRALLKELSELRKRGYASEQGEFLPDVSGVAVPVLFEDGRPLAALGIVGPSTRISPRLDELGAITQKAASGLRPSASYEAIAQPA